MGAARAANQFFMLSEPERATIFLNNTKNRIGSSSSRVTLEALSATFAMNAGQRLAGRRCLPPRSWPLRCQRHGGGVGRQLGRVVLGTDGPFDQVRPMVDRALGAEHPGLLRFTVGLAETTTLLMSGQAQAAYRTASRFTDFAELTQPGRAIGEVLLAQVLIARGRPAELPNFSDRRR